MVTSHSTQRDQTLIAITIAFKNQEYVFNNVHFSPEKLFQVCQSLIVVLCNKFVYLKHVNVLLFFFAGEAEEQKKYPEYSREPKKTHIKLCQHINDGHQY